MPKYFRVIASHGSVLSWNWYRGEVASVLEAMPGDYYPAVLACTPEVQTDICFLAAEGQDAVPIRLQPQMFSNVLLPVGIRWLSGDSCAFFFDPLTRRCLTAAPSPDPRTPGTVAFQGSRFDEQGTFRLLSVRPSQVSGRVRKGMAKIERVLKTAHLAEIAERMMECISKSEAEIVLNAVWPLLGRADLETLGTTLIHDQQIRNRLATLLPNDIWAAVALPVLAEWLVSRDTDAHPIRRVKLDTAHDFLGDAGLNGEICSFGHVCNVYARSSIKPRRNICIVAAARNEGLYLLEWIAYHRCIGVDSFFLYTNDNDDGSDELLSRLADAGILTWIDNRVAPGTSAQNKAYGHAFGVLPDVLDYRWALTIDLDEFFVFESSQFASLRDFLRWHQMRDVDAIACSWVYVGSGNSLTWQDVPVIARNDRLLGAQHVGTGYRLVKAMSRPHRIIHSTPHASVTDTRRKLIYRYSNGELEWYKHQPVLDGRNLPRFVDAPDLDYACVYHYFFKSAEEFLWKLCRNRGDHPVTKGLLQEPINPDLINAFMVQRQAIDVERNDRIARCARTFDIELGRLLALPGIAEANMRVQCNFREQMGKLKQLFRSAPDLQITNGSQGQFLELAGVKHV